MAGLCYFYINLINNKKLRYTYFDHMKKGYSVLLT
jgi:hypothetical protein